jgi:uncharacterized protein YecE (DUF72 family)
LFSPGQQVVTMRMFTGTSGFSYKEWRGIFYPDGMSPDAMLAYYGGRLNAVEINNTFYRLPKAGLLEGWAGQVPESFRFSIKASRRITHMKRLRNAESESEYLFRTVAALGDRLGVLFFQLPPYLPKDTAKLDQYAALIPKAIPAAFQFKHPSWQDPEVIDVLTRHGIAWCTSDEEEADPALFATAPFGYLRLRRDAYSAADLEAWRERVAAQPWEKAFVFFKDEEKARGPRFAEALLGLQNG